MLKYEELVINLMNKVSFIRYKFYCHNINLHLCSKLHHYAHCTKITGLSKAKTRPTCEKHYSTITFIFPTPLLIPHLNTEQVFFCLIDLH